MTAGNLARVDSVAAVFNNTNGNLDEAVATVVTAGYQMNRNWAPMVRLGFVGNDAPGEATDGRSFANPLVGATYARALGGYRLLRCSARRRSHRNAGAATLRTSERPRRTPPPARRVR